MATMDDIAKKLGISKGTVSKALSGATDISEAMRRSVLETAVELGYSRIPRSNTAPRLCILIENMQYERSDDFGWDLVTGFRKMAEPAGHDVDIIPLTAAMQKEMHYDEFMLKHNYIGSFVLGINYTDPWLNEFQTCRTPTVLFDNKVTYNPMVVHVGVNNEEAMDLAIQGLKERGHTRIGYLSGALGSFVFQDRYLAFFHALKKNHLEDNRAQAGHAFHSTECIEKNLPRIMDLGCTAIICSHDLLAQTTMIHCAERGINIPGDLSIVGIDDLPFCRYTVPSLSSIRQDRTELGKSAYYALSCQINRIHIDSLTLHPEIFFRNSVGPAPQK